MPNDTSPQNLFDKNAIIRNRNRCGTHLPEHGFLFDWVANELKNRLNDIKKEFPNKLQIGLRNNPLMEGMITLDIAKNLNPDIIADEEFLPIAPQSQDIIINCLSLHELNDLPGALIQARQALKPDGLFIGALFGSETLKELRASMQHAELETLGGVSPRVFPFADMADMGALMQRAGFNLPVVDSEKITVSYETPYKLMLDIRRMGEGNALNSRLKAFSQKQLFAETTVFYHQNFPDNRDPRRINATFEIIFVLGWAPHESQQKPLRPGSAENRLADALKTEEKKL